jgi:galactose mutarotase-like enzyme
MANKDLKEYQNMGNHIYFYLNQKKRAGKDSVLAILANT